MREKRGCLFLYNKSGKRGKFVSFPQTSNSSSEMKLLTVFLLTLAQILKISHSRSLLPELEMSNDIGVEIDPQNSLAEPADEWVKLSTVPKKIITKNVGSSLELECEATGSPPPMIQWFKDDQPLTTQTESYENNIIAETTSVGTAKLKSRLVIHYLVPLLQGTIRCVAQSGSEKKESQTIMIVKEKKNYNLSRNIYGTHHKPRIVLFSPNYMDIIGHDIVLPCQTVGNPKPDLIWMDSQGKMITEDENRRIHVIPDGGLKIQDLAWSDLGLYTCSVRNSLGEDHAETFIYPMRPE